MRGKKEALILLFGDLLFLVVSLWLTLFLRYYKLPDADVFILHFRPFSILFFLWITTFFISGLYDKHTNAFKRKLPEVIFNAQLTNCLLAIIFFYFVTYFSIAPKINLFIYLFITIFFISVWRIFLLNYLYSWRSENVLIIGDVPEADEITEEFNSNRKYGLAVARKAKQLRETALGDVPGKISTIIVDFNTMSYGVGDTYGLSQLIFLRVKFIDLNNLYEDIFNKIPLNNLSDVWFLKNTSNLHKTVYDVLKRFMDIIASIVVGIIFLPLYPLVYMAIKLEDGGPVLIVQDRIGLGNKIIKVIKFRSMKESDSGKWLTKNDDRITQVGWFIRKTRIDELPQLWNVLRGDLSLIGPRPDICNLGIKLREEIPFYTMRNLIKPGLSGWAQIHQDKPPQSIGETKERLAYDFYYLKNRSFILDIQIALKTIKTLLSRGGL